MKSICKPLNPEDYVAQPVVDVSPPKWHLAHTTWFFETFVLEPFKSGYQVYNQDYSFIFNSYYQSVGDRVIRADRGNLTRPTVDDIYQYRRHVDRHVEELLKGQFIAEEEFQKVFEIGIQHEQQHQELLITDIKYILGHNPLFPNYFAREEIQPQLPGRGANYLEVDHGNYQIGHHGAGFCFDNELGRHQVYLPAFKIMDRLVTNDEYLKFINDKGYHDFRYWLMEGWEWVQSENIAAPMYWYCIDDSWHYYNLKGLEPLDGNAPVTHISFYEADAYARWRGMRLPTEFEWEIACQQYQLEIPEASFQEGDLFQPTPASKDNFQFFGDAWEWTSSAYRPYPYFVKEEGALGEYNGKFMINQMVLKGGSCATPHSHIRATYRNFFHPNLRWQFTGLRLASYL